MGTPKTMVKAESLSKSFADRTVVNNLTFSVTSGEVLGILGSNGSGKSTLLRMIGGLLRPDAGTVSLLVGGEEIPQGARPQLAGLVAPYMQVYDEFTPLELMAMHTAMRGRISTRDKTSAEAGGRASDVDVLTRVGLYERRNDVIRSFSSGLLQRTILALAVHHEPPLLLLDEPSVTMDDEGRRIIQSEIALQCNRGGVVFLATNDSREHDLCTRTLSLP